MKKILLLITIAILAPITAAHASGWYLMVPPWVAPYTFDSTAPIAQWTQSQGFDSAHACQQSLISSINDFAHNRLRLAADVSHYNARLYSNARCVAANDPRLGR